MSRSPGKGLFAGWQSQGLDERGRVVKEGGDTQVSYEVTTTMAPDDIRMWTQNLHRVPPLAGLAVEDSMVLDDARYGTIYLTVYHPPWFLEPLGPLPLAS